MQVNQLNTATIKQFSSQELKEDFLHRINNTQRGLGANPCMGKIFMSRVEKLVNEFNASGSTPESIHRILQGMESDFGTIECYNEFIQALKQEMEKGAA
ncbi:MAG: hypothetical protein OQK12_07840 [Motiliproteus sp.]|nr:hypothetical protein [Motiliproteus sp.]MCW9053902.1 hypothetical protein [Motiliproteus sp.]